MKLVFKYVLQFEVSNLCFGIHSYMSKRHVLISLLYISLPKEKKKKKKERKKMLTKDGFHSFFTFVEE